MKKILFLSCLFLAFFCQADAQLNSTIDTSSIRKNSTRKETGTNPTTGTPVKVVDSVSDLEKRLFGYNVFHNNSTSFSPNLNMATPKSYVVGPGDVLKVQVYGVAQSSYILNVSPEGSVTINEIGVAHVGGFTIEAVKAILEAKMSIRYAGMKGDNPNTFLQVTLDNIRNIKVNMVGEFYKPGTYTIPSYVSVFDALFAAGGPTTLGSFRYVQVYRANKLAGEVDIYDYLVNGKFSKNVRLEDGDIILIRPSSNIVQIDGEVRTPGYFEMKPNESFQDLLKYAGGFSANAFKQLVRITRRGLIQKEIFDLAANQFAKTSLNDGDQIKVDIIANRYSNRVQVTGSVNRPGAYELNTGMKVKDILQKAGGLKGDAFLKRAIIYRTRPDYTQEVIAVNLTSADDAQNNILLQPEDVLSISSLYDLKEEYYVQISGEVNNVGIFPYADSMTIAGLVLKAGGFKYSASGSYIEVVRRVENDQGKVADVFTVAINKDLAIEGEKEKMILRPFDHVYVRNTPGFQLPKTVTVEGEAMINGQFAIDKKEMRISDLIKRAGGVTKYAYLQGATLLRKTKNFVSKTITEQENETLTRLLASIYKDSLLAKTESSQEFIKRIKEKITNNAQNIAKEQETKERDVQKKEIVKENANNLLSANAKTNEEKDQDLVAINLEAIIKNPLGNEDLVLKDGDVLTIPEKLETVSVKGGVLYPVSIHYEPKLSFKEYINRSGGYNSKAIRNGSYVLQANGRVEKVKHFLFIKSYPRIEPGAEIFVPINTADKSTFNYQAALGMITSTLTLIFLLRTL